MSSPYKKMKTTNQSWIGFTNISKLTPNKAYRMLNITETNHAEYGPGQQAVILAHDNRKWRTQLPGKYLAQLTKEDIQQIKQDVINEKNVFLVFREKMIDNSYRIDITENDLWLDNFKKNLDVPEMEVSLEGEQDTSETVDGNGANGSGNQNLEDDRSDKGNHANGSGKEDGDTFSEKKTED